MSNLILCGFKSCGKSSLAKKIAFATGGHYIDTDHLISKNCRELYLRRGADFFRKKEKEVVHGLYRSELKNWIIAAGGGTLLDQDNVFFLKKLGPLFYLRVDKEELKRRIFVHSSPPPFLTIENFEETYRFRSLLYEAVADYTIDHHDSLSTLCKII